MNRVAINLSDAQESRNYDSLIVQSVLIFLDVIYNLILTLYSFNSQYL